MSKFPNIVDTRQRLQARLNLALRTHPQMSLMDNALMQELADAKLWGLWSDFERDTIANFIIAVIEDEFAINLAKSIDEETETYAI